MAHWCGGTWTLLAHTSASPTQSVSPADNILSISRTFLPTPTKDTFSTRNSSANMLYLVGLGLADEKDITVKGLEIVKKAERVYLEAYTAVLLVEKDVLVSLW